MKSSVSKAFRDQLSRLPQAVQRQAARAYRLWLDDPIHTSLQFKRASLRQPVYSVRISGQYRAVGLRDGEHMHWFWIGSHTEYDELLKRI